MGIESCSTWPPLSIHSQRDLTCPLLPLNHSHVHNRHHYPSPWGLWLWLTCSCHDLSMFTLIYYRLYIFNYKYLAVAVVSPQPCLHLTLASIQQAPHCFLSFSVSVGLLCPHQISSDHHWPSCLHRILSHSSWAPRPSKALTWWLYDYHESFLCPHYCLVLFLKAMSWLIPRIIILGGYVSIYYIEQSYPSWCAWRSSKFQYTG